MNSILSPYKIGSRKSLLALTQSQFIQSLLEPDIVTEINPLETQGDQIADKALWQIEGKDFFTKELDQVLLSGSVDLVVHSYKDLGSVRPPGLEVVAVPPRELAHDILLIKNPSKNFVIGTSSPRRIVNCQHLNELLSFAPEKIETKILRGNVQTRLKKLQANDYDGILLALAGLERLSQREDTWADLKTHLQGLSCVVLPQSLFPTAASQGALAVECRSLEMDNSQRNQKLHQLLKKIHHPETWEVVAQERAAFKHYGGGCHLPVGIHVRRTDQGDLHYHRGECDGEKISLCEYKRKKPLPPRPASLFIGMPAHSSDSLKDQLIQKVPLATNSPPADSYFVTSRHTLPSLKSAQKVWVAGQKTWKKALEAGHWVLGSADSLGHQELEQLFHSKVLGFLVGEKLLVLSHAKAQSHLGEVIPSYDHQQHEPSPSFVQALKDCHAFYWTSFRQYQTYLTRFPFLQKKIHACGLGKTLEGFQKEGIDVIAFPSLTHFKNWK